VRVLFFGTYDAARHPRVAVLREGLAARGLHVTECNHPLEVDTAARVRLLRAPWRAIPPALRLAGSWRRLWRQARRLPAPDAVVVGYLGELDVHLARRFFPRARIVLDHLAPLRGTAADRGARGSAVPALLERLDAAAERAADLIVVDTPEHASLLPEASRARAVVVPVGAPHRWFAGDRDRRGPPMRVVFFGLYTPLQGTPVIGEAIAKLRAEPISFTMIGTGQDEAATRHAASGASKVRWIPWCDPDDLPREVVSHDVALGIFGSTAKGARVVPNKVFQAAAAGCAVVTSDTPPQRRALGDAAVFVPPGDAGALAEVLRELASDHTRLEALRTAARSRAEADFRPERVVDELVERLRT
jgi:glycosyltransferase involved in cell wall biosynthesis